MKIEVSRNNKESQINKVIIPPSKSQLHRALICASLASGISVIKNVALSEDIRATIEGLQVLGATITYHDKEIHVEGITNWKEWAKKEVNCKESGSTLRFLIPLFAQTEDKVVFKGSLRLLERPLNVYQAIFDKQEKLFHNSQNQLVIQGPLHGDDFIIPGNISSQFISGLLMMLPLLDEDSTIQIDGSFESSSYVKLTIDMMKHFGVRVIEESVGKYSIKGNQRYVPQNFSIEGDYSQFAFFATLGCFVGPLECLGLNSNSMQGDRVIVDYLREMGAQIQPIPGGYRIEKSNLQGKELSLKDCPDLGPILSVTGSLAQGETTLANVERLRLKESDRVTVMQKELKKCSIQTVFSEDKLIIQGKKTWAVLDGLCGHKDHRVVMALVVGALCSNQVVEIDGAEAINKSYPSFFEEIRRLGFSIIEKSEV